MKIWDRLCHLGVVLAMMFAVGNVQGAGLLTPVGGQFPALKIKSHTVDVIVEDGYAMTRVEQVFHNPHATDLAAMYSFPVPEHGAVAEFTVWIDGQPVTGEVLEKQHARQVYAEEKAAGRDAGLTEKDSYRTFEVSVTPVRAGQDTRIRIVYLQPAHVDSGIGRYVYPLEEGGVDEQKLAFWMANETVEEHFQFTLTLKSGYPVEALRVPNQGEAVVSQGDGGQWQVRLGASQHRLGAQADAASQPAPSTAGVYTLDKDIVVYWRHQAGLPGSVDLVAYKPDGAHRGTFMLTLTPGDDLQPVTEGMDWVFVLDVSGSMRGKYATLADGVQQALGKLRSDDRFRIVLFNSGVRELTSGYVHATPEMVSQYSQAVAQVNPDSGTNLYGGLRLGLDAVDADRTSAIVLVTDGVANVGETQQRKFLELLKTKDIRLFTFILGNSANRPLLQALAKASNGFALNISNSDDIVGQLLTASSKVTHQALHGVTLNISGIKTADVTPSAIGSLYRGQQLVVFGHYWGDGLADVELRGRISGEDKVYRTQFAFPAVAISNPEIERLWAYAAIEGMVEDIHNFGDDADLRQAVVDLGVEYSLVTDYTSMVVVRDEVFDARGIERRNQQRLATEHAAQQQRAQHPAVSRRVDAEQPMFNTSRPSFSGGGALDVWMLLALGPMAWWLRRGTLLSTKRRR